MPARVETSKPVLLFDGVCGLCDRLVDFILKYDTRQRFMLCALQSPAGEELLQRHGLNRNYLQSFVLIHNGQAYTHSTGALHVARLLGWPWKIAYALVIVPKVLRDPVYNFIARHRYRWFGQRDACRLPTPQVRERFIVKA